MNELIEERILTKGIKAEDIKHKDRLSSSQIRSIPLANVYMWVRTGEWKQKDLKKWFDAFESL